VAEPARPEGLYPLPTVRHFPTFHIVFHMRVENSYFSTDYNRLYRGCKSPAANNI